MTDQHDTATRGSRWNFDHGRIKNLALGAAFAGLVAAIIVFAATSPAHACLLPGIPC